MKLQAEIKQSRPFDSLREEAFLNVWRTADHFSQALQALFKSNGISHAQYNVLRILRGAGRDGLASSEIAARMITRDPDVTRLMDRLERAALARRYRQEQDRRVILSKITPKGLKLLQDLDHPVLQLIEETLGHMEDSRVKSLSRLLEVARARPS